MSILNQICAKPKTIVINGVSLTLKPLTNQHLDLFMDFAQNSKDENQKLAIMQKIVEVTLKESVPDVTDEELKSIGFGYFAEIMSVITEINGMTNDEPAGKSQQFNKS